ncbi:activating signal cointegrator 1 complex subunit 2-like [Haliotis cracherodii]|uniref:activating signal cointegrator 1 complex subunit 2-like n=1 Tax=Haliotis cracherodii TaxID=6455 RepID=UPI0039E8155F
MTAPLDKKQVPFDDSSGKRDHLPALHPKWLEKMVFVAYTPPPTDITDRGQYEQWLERLKFIAEDLHWLLQLPHDKFWCQAVFNESLLTLLDTYLRFSPRSYDVIYDLPNDGRERHLEVHRLVFMTCVRMATHKESKDDHITPSVFGDILYENFIFDVPKLLDLCVLYGGGNGALLTKMITNIFTQQPKYADDLRATIPTIIQVLENTQDMCGVTSSFTPEKLGKARSKDPRLHTMTVKEFQDVIFYLADTAITISNFLDVYPPAAHIFHEFRFEQKLASFYEGIVPEIQAALKVREFETMSHKRLLKQKLHQSRRSLQKIFHTILEHTCIQPVLEKGGEDVAENIEDFLHTMSAVLGERRFLADYESRYSFQEYADVMCQTSCDIDETQVQYIHDAINSAYATFGKRKKPKGAMSAGGRTSPDGSPGPLEEGAVGGAGAIGGGAGAMGGGAGAMGGEAIGEADGEALDDYSSQGYGGDVYQTEDYDLHGACAPRPSNIEIDSLVSSVKDLLPELGDGFIEVLLEEFGYNLEQAINAVLTDKLPPSLNDIDRFMERESFEEVPSSLVDQRANIFDNDQFDVFRKDNVDMSRIHKGKRGDDISLDDKSTVKQLKATYDAYGSRDQASMYDNLPDYEYDDEYDDTYDTNNIGAQDEDSAEELTARRPFVVPRALQTGRETKRQVVESEGSDDEKPARDDFVQDPAKLREIAEQKRQWHSARGRGGRIRQQHNVVGKPKGQGQENDVVRNRKFKEKNKAARGNHNRRAGADRKRGRGMMAI